MTELLIRLFVKNPEDVKNMEVRTRYGVLGSITGIFCNVLLFLCKFLAGVFMHSIAVMADAFNNLSDAASNIISFVGVKMASKPADKDHPFGHGRIEYIAALIVSFLVIQVGFTFFKSSIDKIFHPETVDFEIVPFVILGVSILVKFWMALFNRKLGKKIDSKVLLAAATDSVGDVIITTATMAAILVGHLVQVNIDGYAGVVVSLVVMWAGISIARDTLEPLIGEAIDPELCENITTRVEEYDGIVGTHDLIVHNYGPNHSMASVHAEVPRDVDIETSHEIIDRIEREVSKELGIFLVIHMDPVETHDGPILEAKEQVQQMLNAIDEEISFHDFRMVSGKKQINLIFDVVVPFTYEKAEILELEGKIADGMNRIDERYSCVITIDKSFIAKNEKKA